MRLLFATLLSLLAGCSSPTPGPTCISCTGRQCGSDGCSGSCGSCAQGQSCTAEGMCAACVPVCDGKQCGPDRCGGSCGPCSGGLNCNVTTGQCQSCVPQCENKFCGPDGCGGTCGPATCPSNGSQALTCTASGICKCNPTCTPDCDGRACGDDGCGGSCGACGADKVCAYDRAQTPAWQCQTSGAASPSMSFFVTSVGNGAEGGDYGGLAGADARCTLLAETAGVTGKTWHAYLSLVGMPARNRIGNGPWVNAAGAPIVPMSCTGAACLTALHTDGLAAELVLTEKRTQVDWKNAHDILTGSDAQGQPTGMDCRGYTSNAGADMVTVGHSNGLRAGTMESWNSAHATNCDEVGLQCTASRGHLYCFAL